MEPLNIVFPLAGLNFRPASAKEAVDKIEIGQGARLERDPENAYDYNAVKVFVEVPNDADEAEEHWIGFVPKVDNPEIASHLDAGKPYEAEVCGWAGTRKPMIKVTLLEAE